LITKEQNELMTRIGPGTRMGALLRRYWHPVAALDEMKDRWTKRVRILGEDLVLYKTRAGKLGLIEESCPHRRASFYHGIPTQDGIRCMYHGWEFDGAGVCTHMPFEKGRNALQGRKIADAYPVEELGGLLFAYLGPQPAPLLPRFAEFTWANCVRSVGRHDIPCNWLQCMENSADPVHTEWLHGQLHEFRHEKEGVKTAIAHKHDRIAFDEFPYGLVKRRLYEGQSETAEDWTVGHPIVFPNILLVGSGGGLWKAHTFQIRVPIDDENTAHWWYHAYVPPQGMTPREEYLNRAPYYEPVLKTPDGEYDLEMIDAQDIMAWVTQGEIADRTRENLAASDTGVVAYRRMLLRELEKIERGEDPIGTIRDPANNGPISLPIEKGKNMLSDGFASYLTRMAVQHSPVREELVRLFTPRREAAE
jgi:5,5'-dehydrodivanillate O-demethylase